MFLFTGKKTVKSDRGTYVGEVRKRTQIKEGNGKFDYNGGLCYEGDWKNDKRHGHGTYLNSNSGDVYNGEWANDKQNGSGTLTYSNGDVYSGNWLDDEKSGQGTLTFSNKDVYKGEFSSDKMHGHGVYKEYTIMSTYTGEFKEGKKHGAFIIQPYVGNVRHVRYNEGEVVVNKIAAAHVTANDLAQKASSLTTLNKSVFDDPLTVPLFEKKISSNDPLLNNTTTDQELLSSTLNVQTITEEDGIYVGEVRAGTEIKEGTGKFTWTDGDSYEGQWENGNKSGHGTYFLSNGAKYEGMYQENKMHGKGTFTYPNRDVYVGDFIHGNKHGQGTYTYSNGEVYIGEWKDDKKNGKGCCGSAAGDLYEAIYVNGLRRGYGSVTFINGDVWSGEYADDLRVSGTMKYKNGDIYEGLWKLGNRHGYGKMTDADGTVWEGEWCEDVKVETKIQASKQTATDETTVAAHPLKRPAFTTTIGAKSDNIINFQQTRLSELTALYPQLISLSQHSQQFQSLATASPQTIEYLKSLGDSGVIAEQQYALILSNPLMHEYYIAYIQSVSSAVLACQTINSGMVLNNKRSKPEKVMKLIDQAANSVGFLVCLLPLACVLIC